jgi:hypothetical protein
MELKKGEGGGKNTAVLSLFRLLDRTAANLPTMLYFQDITNSQSIVLLIINKKFENKIPLERHYYSQ